MTESYRPTGESANNQNRGNTETIGDSNLYQGGLWQHGRSTELKSKPGKAKAARNSLKHGLRWQSLSERESKPVRDLFSQLARRRKAILKKFTENSR